MFISRNTTIDNIKTILSVIEDYGVDYLIRVFKRLREIQMYHYTLTDSLLARYGDQRSKESRIIRENDDILRRLVSADISFDSFERNFYFEDLRIPFEIFLWQMKFEMLNHGWTIERYREVIEELNKIGFNKFRLDYKDWTRFNVFKEASYFLANDNGDMFLRKVYNDQKIYIETYATPFVPEIFNEYSNTIWNYFVDPSWCESSWVSTVEISTENEKKIESCIHLRTLAIDIEEIPSKNEIESIEFDPQKAYILRK